MHNDAEENGVARCIGIVSLQMPFWWDHSTEPEKKICKKRIKGGACAINGLIRWFLDVTG